MQKQATFYLVDENAPQATLEGRLIYSLELAQHYAIQGARVYIQSQDQSQAESLDELFWQAADRYLPHQLLAEDSSYSTPIQIGYLGQTPHQNRQLMINLADYCPDQRTSILHKQVTQVVDFVLCEKDAKQNARLRYAYYRQLGFSLDTLSLGNK